MGPSPTRPGRKPGLGVFLLFELEPLISLSLKNRSRPTLSVVRHLSVPSVEGQSAEDDAGAVAEGAQEALGGGP